MEENGEKTRDQPEEVQRLIERCKAMEKELNELKKRTLAMQKQVEGELKRRKRQLE